MYPSAELPPGGGMKRIEVLARAITPLTSMSFRPTRNQFSNSAHTSFARRDRRAPAGCGFGSGLIEGYADLVFFPPDNMAHAADLI